MAKLGTKEEYIANATEAGLTQAQAEANWTEITTGIVPPGEDVLEPVAEEDLPPGIIPPTITGIVYPTAPAPTPTAPAIIPEVPPITVPTITPPPPPTPPAIPEVPEVPPYEPLPAQVALEEEYAEALREWREAGGYGIPEEVQAQMIQRATDILKSREAESIRVMRNNMERRGITNSGFVFANEMTIKSNTTLAIANSITDVQINSAMMKLASFEKMMGSTAQFIGYLAQESWKTYQPKMAQWEMEARYGLAEYGVAAEYGIAGYQARVQATMAQFQANTLAVMTEWQGKFDLAKMELNQAYIQGNMELASQLQLKLQNDQQAHEIEMAEMEAEAANQTAATTGFWNMLGTTAGFIWGK